LFAITQLHGRRRPKAWLIFVVIALLFGGVAYLFAAEPVTQGQGPRYHVTTLRSLGGNTFNDEAWVAGYSDPGDGNRHGALWRFGRMLDLNTLGGPNSSVIWSVKNTRGFIAGISQTNRLQPLGELWSQQAFFSGVNATNYVCLGFVWKQRQGMMRLPTLSAKHAVLWKDSMIITLGDWAQNGGIRLLLSINEATLSVLSVIRIIQAKFCPALFGQKKAASSFGGLARTHACTRPEPGL
jgi:hypothetical protein